MRKITKILYVNLKEAHDFFSTDTLKKHFVVVLLCLATFIGYYLVLGNEIPKEFFSVAFSLVFSLCIYNLFRAIMGSIEDRSKVTDNDVFLNSIYKNNYCKTCLLNGAEIRFLYDDCFSNDPGQPVTIRVEDQKDLLFQPNALIENNLVALMKAHLGKSKITNCLTVRLDDYEWDGKDLVLRTSRSNYIYHLCTNRAIDYRLSPSLSLTLRNLFEYNPFLQPLKRSQFSNHIGINALVFLKDDWLIIPHRSMTSTISKNQMTSSVATYFIPPSGPDGLTPDYLLRENVINYLQTDLQIPSDHLERCHVDFLGFGRNIYEGGKPQFYFSVHLTDLEKEKYVKPKDAKFLDRNKEYYLGDFKTMQFKNGYLHFKSDRRKSISLEPEKSFLCNLWHYLNTYKQM